MADALDELRIAAAARKKELEACADTLADAYDQWRAAPELETAPVGERDFSSGFRLLREQLDTSTQLLRLRALERRIDDALADARAAPVESAPPPSSPPLPLPLPRPAARPRRRPRVGLIAATAAVVAVILVLGAAWYRNDSSPKQAPIAIAPPLSVVAPRITWSLDATRAVHRGPPCSSTWHYRITLHQGAKYRGKPAVVELSGPDYRRTLRRRIPVSAKGTVELDSQARNCARHDRNKVTLISVADSSNLRKQSDS